MVAQGGAGEIPIPVSKICCQYVSPNCMYEVIVEDDLQCFDKCIRVIVVEDGIFIGK